MTNMYFISISITEAKTQFDKLILNQRIWKLFELHFPTDFLMTYEKADEMGCFDNYDLKNIVSKKSYL